MNTIKNHYVSHKIITGTIAPPHRHRKKGIEQSMWIIITIVVALTTALALIIFLSNTSSNTGTNLEIIIDQINENIRKLLANV